MTPRSGIPFTEAEHAAITLFPMLRRLLDLRHNQHWQFLAHRDEHGEIDLVIGFRTWPDGYGDALGVCALTDAQATRTNPAGEVVFRREGGLVEVLNALVDLPSPGARGAPQLVLAGHVAPLLGSLPAQ